MNVSPVWKAAQLKHRWRDAAQGFAQTMQTWPWLDTVRTLSERFREDRLGLTASSLTFTTLIALVPLVTVMLAVFSAFPLFAGFQLALEKYFLQNLVPPNIAQPVLRALTSFSAKAGQLGTAGFALLVVTAFALILTFDRTLNAIWRVPRARGMARRVLVYWTALTLGPLLVGVSLTFTTYLLSDTTRTARSLSSSAGLVLQVAEFIIFAVGMTAIYRFVPNTHVRWRHALAGGVVVAVGLQLAKHALTWYVGKGSIYTTIYGAFAALPAFLLWIYVMWVVVLLGAVIAAYAPSLSMKMVRQPRTAGHRFSMALAVLKAMVATQVEAHQGLSSQALAAQLRADPLAVEAALGTLTSLGWVGRLDEAGDPRLVLLVNPELTVVQPLVDALLLEPQANNATFRARVNLGQHKLSELLQA